MLKRTEMQVIKLNATDSTNAHIKRMCRREILPDFTVVQAIRQTAGRGQRGERWEAEEGKNLTFSLLKRLEAFPALQHFTLNAAISLSIYTALQDFNIPELSLKWPNDILSGNSKLCGILVENVLQGNFISQSIIGIGLNVNQTAFPNLPWATSMKRLTGEHFNTDQVLSVVLNQLESDLSGIATDAMNILLDQYTAHLYLKDTPAGFLRKDGSPFDGMIRGVSTGGLLQIELPDGSLESFGNKEVQFPKPKR
ncbi:biotin--[acetyl-CoA-carboxylase] ligase [Robiginitalea sp.]|uniref:biotin--[acetyl-CoA-carboxylase] ligase n=1 Tax=Robiginitalea sp. TaxID=1902411 RepID=UPI003C76CF22